MPSKHLLRWHVLRDDDVAAAEMVDGWTTSVAAVAAAGEDVRDGAAAAAVVVDCGDAFGLVGDAFCAGYCWHLGCSVMGLAVGCSFYFVLFQILISIFFSLLTVCFLLQNLTKIIFEEIMGNFFSLFFCSLRM